MWIMSHSALSGQPKPKARFVVDANGEAEDNDPRLVVEGKRILFSSEFLRLGRSGALVFVANADDFAAVMAQSPSGKLNGFDTEHYRV
jgi:hypothetical protein